MPWSETNARRVYNVGFSTESIGCTTLFYSVSRMYVSFKYQNDLTHVVRPFVLFTTVIADGKLDHACKFFVRQAFA